MSSIHALKSGIVASIGALALVATVGCSANAPSQSKPIDSEQSTTATDNKTTSSTTNDTTSSDKTSTPSSTTSETSTTSQTPQTPERPTPEQPAPGGNDAAKQAEEEAIAQGYQVFKGTVRVCTNEELIKLQGLDVDPSIAGNSSGTYAVLVFDEPTDVTGEIADGTGQRTESSKMIGIAEHTDYKNFSIDYGDLERCKELDGQRATLAAKAEGIMFPTDVRLPIGEPSARQSMFIS